jgi:hypothetical protein
MGGYSLIVIGVIGIFVPIMPTVPFLLGAAFMLGWEHKAIKPWIGYLEKFKVARRPGDPKAAVQAGESLATDIKPDLSPGTPSTALRPLGQRE